jgi:hypothetical protein
VGDMPLGSADVPRPITVREVMQRREQVLAIYEAREQARINGTKARLEAEKKKGPNTDPTPGADYKGKSKEELTKALGETHNHAISQWQAGQGVVGPTGSEGNSFFGGLNSPHNSAYEANQNFGYQHDMQATEAELQAQTPEEKRNYKVANAVSATYGFFVLKVTGSNRLALKTTKAIFGNYGFPVTGER